MSPEERFRIYEKIAEQLRSSYEELRLQGLDSGLAGSSAEKILVAWLKEWLPLRVDVRGGAVISRKGGPTTQRDALLFDRLECPVFRRIGDTDLLPIEGVVGAIELNYGLSTGYKKLLRDAAKLSEIKALARARLRRAAMVVSHLQVGRDPEHVTQKERVETTTLHLPQEGRPILLIFAEQLEGTLSECAHRLVEHNKSVGVGESVDGLFVLRQGYALHYNEARRVITQRLPGSHFRCRSTSEGEVLLRMQDILLTHLYMAGKVHPEGFRSYVSGEEERELEHPVEEPVSDAKYAEQTDDDLLMTNLV